MQHFSHSPYPDKPDLISYAFSGAVVLQRQGSDLPTLLRRFWKVAAPYWSSEDKVKARFWLAGVFALTLATTGISVGFNFLGRDFYNALASKYANFDFIKISKIALTSFGQVNYTFGEIASKPSLGLLHN